MITCHLTKLESAVDQIRKGYPKLKPADAGLLASALVLTGRHALALYDEKQYRWPEDYDKLTKAMVKQLESLQQSVEPTKKSSKTAHEDEPVVFPVGLAPHIKAGEALLGGRNDLKALLSDVLQEGVEFVYSPLDIGWQWALDRANWGTVSGGEISRRIKIKGNFTEGAVGLEMGTGAKKRSRKPASGSSKAADAEEALEAQAVVEPVAQEPVPAPSAVVEVEAKPKPAKEPKPAQELKAVKAASKPPAVKATPKAKQPAKPAPAKKKPASKTKPASKGRR